jgi:hypothetical protein
MASGFARESVQNWHTLLVNSISVKIQSIDPDGRRVEPSLAAIDEPTRHVWREASAPEVEVA